MEKKNFIPNILFFIQCVIALSYIVSVIFLDKIVSGVLFTIYIVIFLVSKIFHNMFTKNSKIELYGEFAIERLMIFLPLILLAVGKSITVPVLLIFIAFDLLIWLVNRAMKLNDNKIMFIYYIISYVVLLVGIMLSYFAKVENSYNSFYIFLYLAIILMAIYLIINMVKYNVKYNESKEKKQIEDIIVVAEKLDNASSNELSDKIDDNSDSDNIVE